MGNIINDKTLPSREGEDHINMYTKSNNVLGRELSNMSDSIKIPTVFGIFNTLEGLWFYLKVVLSDMELNKERRGVLEQLKLDSGHAAKVNGTELSTSEKIEYDEDKFKEYFKAAMSMKASLNLPLQTKLGASKLPIVHYYYYGKPNNAKVIMHDDNWITEHWLAIREYYRTRKGDKTITCIGTRKIIPAAAKWAYSFGEDITRYGFTMRSGHAEGMDIAFELGARLNKKPKLEIFVTGPKSDYDDLLVLTPKEREYCLRILHESKVCNWQDKLSDYVLDLYARNVLQVLGRDFVKASDDVVYFAPVDKNFKPTGGTRIAVQLAEYFGIKTFNVKYAYTRLEVEDKFIRPAE